MPQGAAILVDDVEASDLASATQIHVVEGVRRMTTYRIRFPLQADGDGDFALLKDDRLNPGSELGIKVPDGSGQALLVKGPVFGQQIYVDHGAGGAFVDVLGAD